MNAKVTCWMIAGLLAGCATPVFDGRFAYDEGWRLGTVADIGTAAGVHGRSVSDCRDEELSEFDANQSFARVTYHDGRGVRAVIAPVASDSPLHIGDPAYVNIGRCDQFAVPARK